MGGLQGARCWELQGHAPGRILICFAGYNGSIPDPSSPGCLPVQRMPGVCLEPSHFKAAGVQPACPLRATQLPMVYSPLCERCI